MTTNLFGYNMRSELVDAIMGTNFYAYDYDPIGNRRVASMGTVSNVYEANSLNQYSTVSNSLSPATTSLQYDPDGNLVADGIWVYAWDAENRLVGVSPATTNVGSVRLSFAYDYMSRRVKKEVETHDGSVWSNTLAVFYTYDGWNLVCEDASDAPKKNYYVWGLDLSGTLQGAGGVGGLLARVRAENIPQPLYYSCDANGNVTDVLDKNGAVVAHYEYDPYGNTVAQSGDQADANPFRFSSKYWDGETGFYYYGYRFYLTGQGRWMSRDPVADTRNHYPLAGWDGPNLYAFLWNCSLDCWDVLGLFSDGRRYGPESDTDSPWLGHSDMGSLDFDYTKEDHQPDTAPVPKWLGGEGDPGNPAAHFQDFRTSLDQVLAAIQACDHDEFQRKMHRLQDYWSHYDKGYRWDTSRVKRSAAVGYLFAGLPGGIIGIVKEKNNLGHTFAGHKPDHDNDAWQAANNATLMIEQWWYQDCCKCGKLWNKRSVGPCDEE